MIQHYMYDIGLLKVPYKNPNRPPDLPQCWRVLWGCLSMSINYMLQ